MEVVSAADLLSASEQAVLRGDAADVGPTDGSRGPEKARSPKKAPRDRDEGLAKIFVDAGKRDEIFRDDFLDTLEDNGFRTSKVAFVNIRETHSFIGVPEELLNEALECLDGEEVGGLEVKAEKARPRRAD